MNVRKNSVNYKQNQLISRANVLKSLGVHSPATIKQLANRARLSKPTVTKSISQLEELGLVNSKGHKDQPKGRKPALYGLSEEHYWLGVDLEIPDLRIAVYDLSMRLVKSKTDFVCMDEKFENVKENLPRNLIEQVGGFLDSQEISADSILGIGVGVPGMVKGGYFRPFSRLKNPPDISLTEPMEEAFDLPVIIGNDVDLELLAELDRRDLLEEPGVVGVYLAARPSKSADYSVRIGGSVFHLGNTLQGAIGSANEFGHTSVPRTDFEQDTCNCGNSKCLETFVNHKLAENHSESTTEEIAEVLGYKLRDLIFLYNPSLLVLDLLAFPRMVNPVMNNLEEFIQLRREQLGTDGPEVTTPGDSEMACARGACIKSFRNLTVNPEKYSHLLLD